MITDDEDNDLIDHIRDGIRCGDYFIDKDWRLWQKVSTPDAQNPILVDCTDSPSWQRILRGLNTYTPNGGTT
jgi:hypothetical protein